MTNELTEDALTIAGHIRVTVFSKPKGCVQCDATIRELDKKQIPYTKVIVNQDGDEELRKELQAKADDLGIAPTMPCVVVYDPDTDDSKVWFGFQPDEINKLDHLSPKEKP